MTPLWKMLSELESHPELSDDDRIILQPAFDATRRHEVVALPELIVGHVQRLHQKLAQPE